MVSAESATSTVTGVPITASGGVGCGASSTGKSNGKESRGCASLCVQQL